MSNLDINIVSAVICLIALISIIDGIYNDFITEKMFNSISGAINSILFFASFSASMYISTMTFAAMDDKNYKGPLASFIGRLAVYTEGKEMLVYLMSIPVITMILFFLLGLIRSIFDRPIRALADTICRRAKRMGEFFRVLLGVLLELPGGAARIFIAVLLISILVNYYPVGYLASAAEGSGVYNYIHSFAVSPIMNSSIGQGMPGFMWQSVEVFSKGLEKSSILENSDKLKYLGFLRFQYESKSNEEIDAMARKIVGNETDERKKAQLIYKWVGNYLSYDWDKYDNLVNSVEDKDKFGAIHAFTAKKGVCEDYSDLYVAMARSVGLKVRIIVGQGYTNGEWGGHAWNEVYILQEKKWITVDTTWAKSGSYFDREDFYKDHIFEAVAGEW